MTKTTLSVFLLSLTAALGPGVKKRDPIQASREQGCRSCHSFTPGLSHVIDKPVQRATGLPLQSGKRIGCLTCHEDKPGHGKQGLSKRVRLRRSPRKLCESCHTESPERGGKTDHALFLGRAHLTTRGQNPKLSGLDAETRVCLGCHDGSAALDAGHEKPYRSGRMKLEHPIGVKYERNRTNRTNLRPSSMVPPEIRLPGGTVGCGSCHSLYSGRKKRLVMTTQKSKLCLACHDL